MNDHTQLETHRSRSIAQARRFTEHSLNRHYQHENYQLRFTGQLVATRTMEAPHTNAVALKLPAFWVDHPRVWLQQAEAQFALKHITADVTKYYYVVPAVGHSACGCTSIVACARASLAALKASSRSLDHFKLTGLPVNAA